jgi:hypothetical protein
MEDGRSAFKILTNKPKGKRPLGRPRHRWDDNIGMDLKEIGINMSNWVDSTQDRDYWRALVNESLKLQVSRAMGLVTPTEKKPLGSPRAR